MKKLIALFVAIFFLTVNYSAAQVKMTDEQLAACETDAKVPALDKFHKVIAKIWHTYWPTKDIAGFKSVVSEVEKGADSVIAADLPGILRDKKENWTKGIENLKVCVANYKSSVEKDDSTGLVDAAEKLHMQYERLVRMISPITKELDDFHVVLYNIYHYYMPNWEVEKLKDAVKKLAEKKELLMASELKKPAKMTPERQKVYDKRNEKYTIAKTKLGAEVDNVVKVMETGDKDQIKKAIEKMHTAYQACEKIFD